MSTLLRAIIGDPPRLDGALCYGRAPEWDAEDPGTIADAVSTCHRCPALQQCETWLHSLPAHKRPAGVTAGLVVAPLRQSGSIAC